MRDLAGALHVGQDGGLARHDDEGILILAGVIPAGKPAGPGHLVLRGSGKQVAAK